MPERKRSNASFTFDGPANAGEGWLAATKELRAKQPEARILTLTTFDGDTDIHRAIQAAQGYVLKNSTGDKLIPACARLPPGKLRVADRTEAVTIALQRGIIQLQ